MKIYVYTIQHDLIHFKQCAIIAEDDKQAYEYVNSLRERLLATGEAEAIAGPLEFTSSSLISTLIPRNITGKPYHFKEFKCEIEEDSERKSWRDM